MFYDAITIDRQISDYDGTYFTLKCGFSNLKTVQRTIWNYKRGDYTLMRNKIIDTNWESMIHDELIHFSDVTLLFEQWIIFKNLQFILLFLNI